MRSFPIVVLLALAAVVTCATESTPHACADATHEAYCAGWIRRTVACAALDGAPTACDATAGGCLYPPPCSAGEFFLETCAGAEHKWSLGACTSGYATLAPCAMCRPAATGGVVCG